MPEDVLEIVACLTAAPGSDGALCAVITLTDGRELKGKFIVPPSRNLSEVLNGTTSFVEFEPLGEHRIFISKSMVGSVAQIDIAPAPSLPNLQQTFTDPFAVLGIPPDADKDEVHGAYISLAKIYHPDRFDPASLPPEVHNYLSAMARRINAAFDEVKATHERAAQIKAAHEGAKARRAEAVFTSVGKSEAR
jgi:DnaJ-like protein